MINDPFSQTPYRCRFDWGPTGAERAAARGDIIVIVDVLSFSTSVVEAVRRGAVICPCGEDDNTADLAKKLGAEVAVRRHEVPDKGRYSLSPLTYQDVPAKTKIILPSLNGGTCTRCSKSSDYVFAGALTNAGATGKAVSEIMNESALAVTVIACGEREKEPPYDLRPAIEDFLGAGAILSHLPFDKSPEARVCESAFSVSTKDVGSLIGDSVSGRELCEMGFAGDVNFVSQIDLHDTAVILTEDGFHAYK